ncbi:hypothetical protein PVAND_001444 [Polypedilum vanderplanki]|uniref:Uncharacterized protein n=1 Tax=Polypedilum vanderplanki TaxID=319348 RepID=A0A9J6BP96_POLVA|nr:hypothetical protein PVAND_001444 [Polypedilum vanderplanki]
MKLFLKLLTLSSLNFAIFAEIYNFPSNFVWGAASASYQIEGAWNVDGRIPSIWDTASHKNNSSVVDGSTGDDAAMSYYYYEKDIQALKDIGFKTYRFSIAWPRVLTKTNQVNQAGIDYYSKLIDRLKEEEIKPMVTMYHWDLPQYLQDLGGWTNPAIVKYFEHYADTLYKHFGDRVKEWITFNEPATFCDGGYSWGWHAPEIRTEKQIGGYLCSHHILLAHGAAYHLYKNKYFADQQGKVGICLNTGYSFPANENVTDEHVDRAMHFGLGRYANPIYSVDGDYPRVMREAIDQKSTDEGRRWSRLPHFTTAQVESLHGAADFLALNYYTSSLIQPYSHLGWNPADSDSEIHSFHDDNWKRSSSSWLVSVPEGLYHLLLWIKDNYNNPLVYITENGWSDLPMTIEDDGRVEYLREHLAAMSRAITDGCRVETYTVWSLTDNFEWMRGYTERFGIYAINFTDPERKRIPKNSVDLMKQVVRDNFVEVEKD